MICFYSISQIYEKIRRQDIGKFIELNTVFKTQGQQEVNLLSNDSSRKQENQIVITNWHRQYSKICTRTKEKKMSTMDWTS